MTNLSEGREAAGSLVANALNGVSTSLGGMTKHLALAAGKGARTLVMLSSAAGKDGLVPDSAVKAAAAVELLHIATLVHDDVIDDAPTRRGIPTLHREFGKKSAVICGDYLLCVSLSMIAAIENEEKAIAPLVSRFSSALAAVCRGEYSQHLNNGNLNLDVFSYLKIISGKTAALFYISAYLGGILGGESEPAARALGRFGRCLGVVFQIIDDCKDYELTEEQAKKPVGNDILSGVVTLPLILSMRADPGLRGLAEAAIGDTGATARLVEAIRRAGGADEARKLARRYEKSAGRALQNVSPAKRGSLMNLLTKTMTASGAF